MTDQQTLYWYWRNTPSLDPALQAELIEISDQQDAITDRFYKELDFGTAGLRGIIGAGTNRMNIYTVRKATQGLANYINKSCPGERSVVIAYDTRFMSKEFALESALVLARNKIKTYLFQEVAPTPLLSYAIGHLQACAGIVVTASHNPQEYNGYKVYWSHGGQIVDELAEAITSEIKLVGDELAIPTLNRDEAEHDNLLIWLNDQVYLAYLTHVRRLILRKDVIQKQADSVKIVYTPLHGTGKVPVMDLLNSVGFSKVYLVPEQAIPDPTFPTVKYPNPEEPAAYKLALELAHQVEADIIIGTDPDADRLGVMAKTNTGDYQLITGNQLGALLVDYLLGSRKEQGCLPANGVVIKTIVTSTMGSDIAAKYGVKAVDVLTGFKYIGEKIAQYKKDHSQTFLFGYEESYGFLAGDFVRDKDAVQISMLVCEMTAYYQTKSQTLLQRLVELFQEVGYYLEDLVNINLTGLEGQQKIGRIIDSWRENPPLQIGSIAIEIATDYQLCSISRVKECTAQPTTLPKCNALHYVLEDDSWFSIRPSGTEPKLKIYFGVKGTTQEDASHKLAMIKDEVMHRITEIE